MHNAKFIQFTAALRPDTPSYTHTNTQHRSQACMMPTTAPASPQRHAAPLAPCAASRRTLSRRVQSRAALRGCCPTHPAMNTAAHASNAQHVTSLGDARPNERMGRRTRNARRASPIRVTTVMCISLHPQARDPLSRTAMHACGHVCTYRRVMPPARYSSRMSSNLIGSPTRIVNCWPTFTGIHCLWSVHNTMHRVRACRCINQPPTTYPTPRMCSIPRW